MAEFSKNAIIVIIILPKVQFKNRLILGNHN